MGTLIRNIVILLLVRVSAHAAIVASASITVPQVQTDYFCCQARQDVSFDYSLLVSGSTGPGVADLNVRLLGMTNETPYPAPWNFEGDAGLAIQGVGAFSAYWWTPGAPTSAACPCRVPFTFGVQETLHFTGYAAAFFSAMPGTSIPGGLGGTTITASVDLSGIGAIYDSKGMIVRDASVSFVDSPIQSLPEPSCFSPLLFLLSFGAYLSTRSRPRLHGGLGMSAATSRNRIVMANSETLADNSQYPVVIRSAAALGMPVESSDALLEAVID